MTTTNANAPSIPKFVKITQHFTDGDNWKKSEVHIYSNKKEFDLATLNETLLAIVSEELVPAKYDMVSIADLDHPEQATNGVQHCFVRIDEEDIEFIDEAHQEVIGDISELVSNIRLVEENGELDSYKALTESVRKELVLLAKEPMDKLGLITIRKDELESLQSAANQFGHLDANLLTSVACRALKKPSTFAYWEKQGVKASDLRTLLNDLERSNANTEG